MMISPEKQTAFENDYNALCQKHGVRLAAQIATRTYGPMLQVEPVLTVEPIPGWQPPVPDPAPQPRPEFDVLPALESNV